MMHYSIALLNIDARKNKFQIELKIETFFEHTSIEDQMLFYHIYAEIIR